MFSRLLAAALLIVPCAWPQPFSRQYGDALQGILELEPAAAAALEAQLAANPEDYAARLKLLAYDLRADRAALASSRRRRTELVAWLIEHHPDSEILASPYARFETNEPAGRLATLWPIAVQHHAGNAQVLWNAAAFYAPRDPQNYLRSAEAALAIDPGASRGATTLGLFYARQIVDRSSLAQLAIARLDSSNNALVLEAATRLLKSAYNKSQMFPPAQPRFGELAARYFTRARALDPKLDTAWVNPAPPPSVPANGIPANAGFRQLKPAAFADLPRAIAAQLEARNCTIPQPSAEGAPRNVLHGEFFEKGQTAWAVLCAAQGSAAILAFRSAADTHPAELEKREIQGFLARTPAGIFLYDRQIRAAGGKFIVDHYRASGGPAPPPIDHLGIDDGSEHGSLTLYWYQGQWRKLTGAD